MLANTLFGPASTSLTHRIRGQARSYTVLRSVGGPHHSLRIRPMQTHCRSQAHHRYSDAIHSCRSRLAGEHVVDPTSTSLTHRIRQQAGSYSFRAASGVHATACESGRRRISVAKHTTVVRTQSISVGAGLLANTSFDPASTSLTHRVRQQAGSYRFCAASGFVPARESGRCRQPPPPQPGITAARRTTIFRMKSISVGAGLLANTSFDLASTSLTHRIRQQAGSYRFCAAFGVLGRPLRQRAARDVEPS